MKNRIQWLGQILTFCFLLLMVFYSFMKHDNFLTIIFMILFIVTRRIFNILVKKGILFNIFQNNDDSNDKFVQIAGAIILYLFAFYARDTGTAKSIFYFTFIIFSIFYIVGQYKKYK